MKSIVSLFLIITMINCHQTMAQVDKVDSVYAAFEKNATEKNIESLNNLFVSPYIPLTIVEKTSNGPTSKNFPAIYWFKYLRTLPKSHKIEVTNRRYVLKNKNMAVAFADFKEFQDNKEFCSGKDIVVFVKPNDHWKILSMNNTLTLYEKPKPSKKIDFSISLKNKLEVIIKAIERKDIQTLADNAIPSVLAAWVSPKMGYDVRLFNLDNFNKHSLNLELIDTKIHVKDDYLAMVEVSFKAAKKKKVNVFLVFQGTNENGWQLTTIVGKK